MELNREQIIKALECFHQRILETGLAEKVYEAEIMAIVDAIDLIRELTESLDRVQRQCGEIIVECDERDAERLKQVAKLTEEKERISHESECHRQTVIDTLRESLEYLTEETERVKADTVREMQERLQDSFEYGEYYSYTRTDIFAIIDQIAQEILEEG